jgi:hypothetical protein
MRIYIEFYIRAGHDCRLTAKSGHVLRRLLDSSRSLGFGGSGGIAVRAGLWVGRVFGQEDYKGFRGTEIGWALGHRRSCILYMKEKCKEKCNQYQWDAVAAVTEPSRKPKPDLS